MGYEPLPLETDPDAVTARILDGLALRIPGFVATEGDPLVALAEEMGRETANLRVLARDAAAAALANLGESAFGITFLAGIRASVVVRLTLVEAGASVPAGFTVVGLGPGDIEVPFVLDTETTAGPTDTTLDVTMYAREVGEYANGIPIGTLRIVTATAAVSDAVALSASDNGLDPETQQNYLDRLVAQLTLLRPGGVLAADLAVLARSVPGVYRALGVDNYDADTNTYGAARTASVFPIDENGDPVSSAIATAVQELVESVREVNFVARVGEPTYTPVAVTFTAVAEPGFEPATVQESVREAGLAYLNPASWALGGDERQPTWEPLSVVRYLDVARVLGSAPGVAYLSSLTLNGGTADVTLPGAAPLPAPTDAATPTTVTGTAV